MPLILYNRYKLREKKALVHRYAEKQHGGHNYLYFVYLPFNMCYLEVFFSFCFLLH